MTTAKKVKAYFAQEHRFKHEIEVLRALAQTTEVEETFKWQFPTYTLDDKNVFSICRFTHHFGIWFFKGALLKDAPGVLVNAQKGKTQAMRHWKFNAMEELNPELIHVYFLEAIENEKLGKIVAQKTTKTVEVPLLLSNSLHGDESLKRAFKKLTPYKQKEFSSYINDAKQDSTKLKRLQKIIPMIIAGVGLSDKYR